MYYRAAFFDRDGIVNRRLMNNYVKSIEEFEFIPEFFKLFSFFKRNNFICIVVTNQQCIGKKIIDTEKLTKIHNFMQKQLLLHTQYQFDGIYFCPHLADAQCNCRKPNTGMFLNAIKDFNINPGESWTIGDSISDVVAGKNVGTKTILIGDFNAQDKADFIFKNLNEANIFLYNSLNIW